MKKLVTLFLLAFLLLPHARALLLDPPEITFVAIHPDNPDHLVFRVKGATFKAAMSMDAGESFVEWDEQEVPTDWSTHLTHGARRYVLADSLRLLRSDDSGENWIHTGASDFIRQQDTAYWTEVETRSIQKYGSRMPERSELWHPLFAAYTLFYFLFSFFLLRKEGFSARRGSGRKVFLF